MTSTTTTALPTTFAPRWVTAMLTTVLGTSAGGGAAATSLGELDRQAGDGDFGTNLTSAFTRVQDEIQATSPQTFTAWLTAVSRGFLGTGGTSGPLFGMFFRDIARCSAGDSPTLPELADGLAKAVATVQRYGEAQVGHKTMVDALVPAAHKLSEQAAANVDPALALSAAVAAAQAGALNTRDIVARRGRASYVGEVSRGVLDPGAVAAALMIQCAAAAVDGHDGPVDTAWTR